MEQEIKDMQDTHTNVGAAYTALYEIIKTLRAPGGCPWDREQTPLSLRPSLLEETYEVLDALSEYERGASSAHVKEELGDVMLNASMIGYMFEQNGDFCVADIFDEVCEKLIRRHPHVFPESAGRENALSETNTPEQVLAQWEAIKAGVEGRGGVDGQGGKSLLDGIGKGLDPLTRAFKLQKKAAKAGFDWDNPKDVRAKVLEEIAETDEVLALQAAEQAMPAKQTRQTVPTDAADIQSRVEDEIGDLLFAVVNWARHAGVSPAVALEKASAKFCRRFRHVEKRCKETGVDMNRANLTVMDGFWEEAKVIQKNGD